MKKSARIAWGVVIALVVVLLALFAVWFWSLGEARASTPPPIQIHAMSGSVQWHHAGEQDWQTLDGAVAAETGDVVRTGPSSTAQIVWGDRGTTRVDSDSELTIAAMPVDGSVDANAHTRLKLDAGRIWSRLIKLLDLGSSVEVDSGSVVATVRGTTFGAAVTPDGAQFAVTQSVVEIGSEASGTQTLLTDDRWGDFTASGTPRIVRSLQPTDTWAEQNRQMDVSDERDQLASLRERLQNRAKELDGAPVSIIDASESLHLAFASGDQKENLAAAYAERRLARLSVASNDEDAARFGRYINLAGASRDRLLGEWHVLATLRAQTGDGDASKARAWRSELATTSPADEAYTLALMIDDRIDDFLASPDRDQTIANTIVTDIDAFNGYVDTLSVTDADKAGLHRKAEAMRARIQGAGSVPVVVAPQIPAPAPVQPGKQLPGTTKKPTQVITTTNAAPMPTTYQRYQMLAAPSSATIGQAVKLTMFGITSAGQADDLTSRSTFSVIPQYGTVAGNIFLPSSAGTVTLNGLVDGKTVSTVVTVTKSSAPVSTGLQSIAIQLTGPDIMGCSAYNAFKVIATYGNGKTADVTMLSKVTVSDPKLIYVNDGSLMSFCTADQAQADMIATYTEQGVTKTATQTITVARDPAAVLCKSRRICP